MIQANQKTRENAIQRVQKHILEVGLGKVRIPGLSVDDIDEYIQDEYRRLRKLTNEKA